MPSRFECPKCLARATLPAGSEGRKVRCPRCGHGERLGAAGSGRRAHGEDPPNPPRRRKTRPIRKALAAGHRGRDVGRDKILSVAYAEICPTMIAGKTPVEELCPSETRLYEAPRPIPMREEARSTGVSRPMPDPFDGRSENARIVWSPQGADGDSLPAACAEASRQPLFASTMSPERSAVFHPWRRRRWYAVWRSGHGHERRRPRSAWHNVRQLDRLELGCRLVVIASLPVMTKMMLVMHDGGASAVSYFLAAGMWAASIVSLLAVATTLRGTRDVLKYAILKASGLDPACAGPASRGRVRGAAVPGPPWS